MNLFDTVAPAYKIPTIELEEGTWSPQGAQEKYTKACNALKIAQKIADHTPQFLPTYHAQEIREQSAGMVAVFETEEPNQGFYIGVRANLDGKPMEKIWAGWNAPADCYHIIGRETPADINISAQKDLETICNEIKRRLLPHIQEAAQRYNHAKAARIAAQEHRDAQAAQLKGIPGLKVSNNQGYNRVDFHVHNAPTGVTIREGQVYSQEADLHLRIPANRLPDLLRYLLTPSPEQAAANIEHARQTYAEYLRQAAEAEKEHVRHSRKHRADDLRAETLEWYGIDIAPEPEEIAQPEEIQPEPEPEPLPTVAEIEADARAGKVVSLFELSKALSREKARAN